MRILSLSVVGFYLALTALTHQALSRASVSAALHPQAIVAQR
jgi:hypothetical protein